MVSRILYSCSAFCQPGVLMGSLWTVRESWQKAGGNKFQQSQGNYACDVSPSLIGVLLSSKCSPFLVVTRIIYCLKYLFYFLEFIGILENLSHKRLFYPFKNILPVVHKWREIPVCNIIIFWSIHKSLVNHNCENEKKMLQILCSMIWIFYSANMYNSSRKATTHFLVNWFQELGVQSR